MNVTTLLQCMQAQLALHFVSAESSAASAALLAGRGPRTLSAHVWRIFWNRGARASVRPTLSPHWRRSEIAEASTLTLCVETREEIMSEKTTSCSEGIPTDEHHSRVLMMEAPLTKLFVSRDFLPKDRRMLSRDRPL